VKYTDLESRGKGMLCEFEVMRLQPGFVGRSFLASPMHLPEKGRTGAQKTNREAKFVAVYVV
jgi:hypothetical protein